MHSPETSYARYFPTSIPEVARGRVHPVVSYLEAKMIWVRGPVVHLGQVNESRH